MSVKIKGGEKVMSAMKDIAANAKPGTLRVGFLEGATYPDGTSVAMVAAMNEFGHTVKSKNQDGDMEASYFQLPRPFFRNMVERRKAGWPRGLSTALKNSGYNTNFALLQAGEAIAGQLRQSIKDTNSPPLAPSTIERKGFAKPLVDTGHMLNSVDYEVTGFDPGELK